MCEVIEIGFMGYYMWKVRLLPQNKESIIEIKKTDQRYLFFFKAVLWGARITVQLTFFGCKISRITVAKYISEMWLPSKLSLEFKITTDSNYKYNTVPNLLNIGFTVNGPSKVGGEFISVQKKFSFIDNRYRPL
jgi:putative transposase